MALTGEPARFEDYSAPLDKVFEVTAFRPAPGEFATIFQDVTDRKRGEAERRDLEARLSRAERLESVGRLAGGVAHDFNNMLTIILGAAERNLARSEPLDPTLRADLEEIREAAERSAGLTRQLLAFARNQPASPTVIDLNVTVSGMAGMLPQAHRRIRHPVLRVRCGHRARQNRSGAVRPDPCEPLRQREGRRRQRRFEITIETSNVSFDADFCA